MCVPFKILMWTLLAYERRVNIPLHTRVYLLHIAKYLQVWILCMWMGLYKILFHMLMLLDVLGKITWVIYDFLDFSRVKSQISISGVQEIAIHKPFMSGWAVVYTEGSCDISLCFSVFVKVPVYGFSGPQREIYGLRRGWVGDLIFFYANSLVTTRAV